MLVLGLSCLAALSILAEGQAVGNTPQANSTRPYYNPSMQAQSRFVRPPINNPNRGAENESFAPESWRDLVRMNGDVHNVNDFMNLLVTSSGRPVREDDIFRPHETADGKRVITGGGILATSDECSPRNMSVRLPLNYSDGQIAYYPECTMVQRCGGCTPTPFLTCEPQYKEKIVLKVLRARYLYPGALSMRWEGFTSVEVERHLTCRAVCNMRPEDCRSSQRFNPYQCKCQCLRTQRCANGKVWDSDICACRCANERPCCAEEGGEDDRTCTSYFDQDFCECTLKTSISASPNASLAEIEAWLESRRTQDNHHLLQVATPATTPTPTPTTPTPTSSPDCQKLQCPPSFVRVVNAYGHCVCLHRLAAQRGFLGRG